MHLCGTFSLSEEALTCQESVDDFQFFEKTTINFIGYITTLLEEIDDHHHHQCDS